ncbi:MAG TPA: hypothetical protein VE129_11180 [Thermoanaerobaculia bacterium]|nr:hypothetical protein [Thermoanaerobaculia bacterium]
MDDVFVIQCPDCESTLKVDRATGAVLSHEPAALKRKLGSFEEAAAENTRRAERANDLFAASFEREKHKSEILEKTFREALEKAQKDPATRPRSPFDDD